MVSPGLRVALNIPVRAASVGLTGIKLPPQREG
jgi:hypothetical protein